MQKWKQTGPEMQFGTTVLIKNENLHPARWHLAKVVQLNPIEDRLVRIVTVKSGQILFRRDMSKICPPPIDREDSMDDSSFETHIPEK